MGSNDDNNAYKKIFSRSHNQKYARDSSFTFTQSQDGKGLGQ
jgi:hypothetical protein